ncbi:MAG: Coenzyme F420 hydrogenase/dehydrogenase, beta subunit C-terminal domain [Alistipes sp.]|nr:Coenzyme F420 hydrogenase/dehydrogenase, beta subunit C-terminal domain [Alistipes sp.]
MSRNITSPTNKYCTGCGACSVNCPVGAIAIAENLDGFYEPMLDSSKCINCGACQKVCYKYQSTTELPQLTHKECFAIHSTNNDTHQSTTSGGFAYELSRWGVNNGYSIVGVIYDYTINKARTIIINDLANLESLKGSKYIQSYTEEAFKDIITQAKADIHNRFICIGTPCQIFGLRRLIDSNNIQNEFILVDLFCHGVPSYLVWDKYIKYQKDRLGQIKNVNFRCKENGWHQYSIKIIGEKKTYSNYAYNDIFYRYFFDNVALNKSCYTCSLRKSSVASDIRIGDFLGGAYEDREDGISAAVAITEKGARIIEKLKSSKYINIVATHHVSECLKSQSTEDYPDIELRDNVITRLHERDIYQTKRWYIRQFTIKRQIYLGLKSIATLLPYKILITLRRIIRKGRK